MMALKGIRVLNGPCKRLFSTSSLRLASGLKIAFFGSDDFSIESLKKLVEISKSNKDIIDSIDLVSKHPKPVGRYLKQVADVPIVKYARAAKLNIIRAEKNAEITELAKNGYQMAIAVSYGKLIPKNFIESIPYSLNVHPSLLPRYSGASPLQFALLNQDPTTGVTVQTLHPTEFDKGQIVDQTDEIPIEKTETLGSLRDKLSVEGANLLAKVITEGSYKEPKLESKYEYSYAPKITSDMNEVNWEDTTDKIVRQFNTLGPLYSFKEVYLKKKRGPKTHDWRRVIFYDIKKIPIIWGLKPGQFQLEKDMVAIQTGDGTIGVKSLKLEYEKEEDGVKFMTSLKKRSGNTPKIFTKNLKKEVIQ